MNFIQTIYLLFRCVWTLLLSYLSGMERCWTLSVTQALNGNHATLVLYIVLDIWKINAENCDSALLIVSFCPSQYFCLIELHRFIWRWNFIISTISCKLHVAVTSFMLILLIFSWILKTFLILGYSKLQYSNISIILEVEFNVWTKSLSVAGKL